ncbi:ABC transporter transmembrane domain-containing protein [Shewanella sp. 10N.286.51.B2]|uniref:ABC transporter transmembrane domain-containing protein n=1 Tax=unclassified Shewanella TaxID=196818 RepID=UPI002410E97C|nr:MULTISPECIES: ABC transporter transmembrane domain-containing protein [unclassified Shewanella]MDO6619169.1 ABC transporter transmembrane domain-containing protein [Shewanella sp. 6_MG-2023]MDO6677261.1 ABC transporter transmembrane domain-containing protein [Shewanella sp. 4_MG-2023]MDO6773923.1 ABC transporter transmembrane domain-containing protein [Shewanella sp. 3_MG-2023]
MPWIMTFLKPYRMRVVAAIIFLFIGSFAWLSLGQGVKMMVDEGFVADNAGRLNEIVLFILVITAVSGTAVFCRFYLMTWLGERVIADIRLKVYNHLLSLSPAFFAEQRTGEVISRFTADSTLLQSVVGSSLSMAFRSSVTVLGAIVMMALTSIKLTGLVLLAVPMVFVPVIFLGKKVRQYSRTSQDKVGDLGAYIDETLHEIHTVQAYGHESKDRYVFNEQVEAVMTAAKSRILYRSILISSVMFLSIAAIALVLWVGAQDVMAQNITAGELSAFMFYAVMAAGAVATISEVFSEIQRASGAAERLVELVNTPIDLPQVTTPQMLPDEVKGQLSLEQLRFAYPSVADDVIKGIDLQIKAGERVALVGESGAGKSTLFELLLRFYQPRSGAVKLDGFDISQLSLNQLREQYALVPQDSVIFATNVLENVRYGRVDASEDEVINACKTAKADEFINELPDGYHTYLGERGVKLSGGQKQRIAIARAILADRPILLLDEATSALDAVSEVYVKQGLDNLMQGRTTLIIAHRLATVINADRIVVLEKGQVVAVGTHQELMHTSEIYNAFASLQLLADIDIGQESA